MNNFIKENWFKISILVLIIVMFGGAFYWFSVRPEQIKKECYQEWIFPGDYDDCLMKHGL